MSQGTPQASLLIEGATEVLTCCEAGGDLVGRVRDGAVAIAGDRIAAVGSSSEVRAAVNVSGALYIDARGKVVAPGFVDCHTHLVFGGSRAREYAARMTRSPSEVAALGIPTGIPATVGMTRAATTDELRWGALDRLARMLRAGTTTVESKSGYGLSAAHELRMLEVNRQLEAAQPIDIVSTFLGAHDFPRDMSRERYVESIINEQIPAVAERGLAEFNDVYCDEGYYSVEQSRRILEAGISAGLKPKIHLDAYANIGGAELAAQLPAVSVDHLNYTTRKEMRRMAKAGVIAVLMPALDFAVAHPRPFDARCILSEGMPVALATDICPGCWAESMQFVMVLACRLYGMSPEEALWSSTMGGAKALGLGCDRGSLEAGKLADIQIWDVPSFEDVIYRLGNNAVEKVIKRGQICYSSDNETVAGGQVP